jgi:hypothetical protein
LKFGLVRLPVREALTGCILYGKHRTVAVVVTKLDAVIVTEIVFGEISMQMFLAAMLINATHAPLEDREVALNGIGGHVTAHIFIGGMSDGFMRGKFLTDCGVEAGFRQYASATRERCCCGPH